MQTNEILQSLFRWMHVVAGILWIGLLYFFNWVNSAFAPTMDGETKKKVLPQLLPRTLFWFRWGAAWTWFTGVLLLLLVFYHGGIMFEGATQNWTLPTFVMLALTFLGFVIYDVIMKTLGTKNIKAAVVFCFLLLVGIVYLEFFWAGWSYRAVNIHIGALFGTAMAFNVWFRIWPAQRKIITAVRDGQAPEPSLVALAGLRSKQNTYMSVPLVWMMINAHTFWAASYWWSVLVAIALGWFVTSHLFKKAPKVKGF